jgi:imidazolonepropionase-like amidohydrolase
MVLGVLASSQAFVDYSTSGLENPLTHLLMILFALRLLERIAWKRRDTEFMIYDLRFTIGRWCVTGLTLAGLGAYSAVKAETLLLTGATVHTVTGETIPAGQVLITDGKISAVGKTVSANGARPVDLNGLHLYPGMIALNTELGLVEIGAVRATRDFSEVGEFTPEVQSWLAVNPDSELLPVARANGVAYFEPAPQGGVVAGHSGLVALDGWTTEQMTVKQSIALHVYWPSAALDTTPRERARNRERWKSLDDQDKARREEIKALDDFFQEARAYAKAREAAKDSSAFLKIPSWEAMLPVIRGAAARTRQRC